MKRKLHQHRIHKKTKQIPVGNDHSKLRLQLFYLDELVQLASESLRKLEDVPSGEQDKDSQNQFIVNQTEKKEPERDNMMFRSFGPIQDDRKEQTETQQIEINSRPNSIIPFESLQAFNSGDYGPQFDALGILNPFDFGRDRSSLKRQQRLFFQDRLPSNNIQTGGREGLLQMKKQGSFLFREYKVPNESEIQEAIKSQMINKGLVIDIKPSEYSKEFNLEEGEENKSLNNTDTISDKVLINQLANGCQIVSQDDNFGEIFHPQKLNSASFGGTNSDSSLHLTKPSINLAVSQLQKHQSESLNENDIIPFPKFEKRDRIVSFEIIDQTLPKIFVNMYDVQGSSDGIKKINDEIFKVQADSDGNQSQFSFSLIQQRKAFHKLWNDERSSSSRHLLNKQNSGVLKEQTNLNSARYLLPPQNFTPQYQQSLNSLKSENSNQTSEYDDYFSSSASSNDSVHSAQYAEQLNNLAADKINIAQKKLNKDQGQPGVLNRKMSVCYDESTSFNALRALAFHESGRPSEHRRSNSILFALPRKMSVYNNDIRKVQGANLFNGGAAGPASGSDSSMQTFGTPQLPNNKKIVRASRFKKRISNISKDVPEAIKINRELIKKRLELASWINRDNEELQMRKDCLQYLRKLGKKFKGTNNLTTFGAIIPEEEDNLRLNNSNNQSSGGPGSEESQRKQFEGAQNIEGMHQPVNQLSNLKLTLDSFEFPNKTKVSQAPPSVLNLIRCSPIIEEEENHDDIQNNRNSLKNSLTLFKIQKEQQSPPSKIGIVDLRYSSNEKKKTPAKRGSYQYFKSNLQSPIRFNDSQESQPLQQSANKSSQSFMLHSILGKMNLNKKELSPNAKSSLSTLKAGKLTALKNSLRDLDTSLQLESDFTSSVVSPNASISPNMRGDLSCSEASQIMLDLSRSLGKRHSALDKTTTTAVDKQLDGFQLKLNRIFSKIASNTSKQPQSSSQSSNEGNGQHNLNKSFGSTSKLTQALRKSITRGISKHQSMRMTSDQINIIQQLNRDPQKITSNMNISNCMDDLVVNKQ